MAFRLGGNVDGARRRALGVRWELGRSSVPVSLSLVAVASVAAAPLALSLAALWHVSAARCRTVSDRMSTIRPHVGVFATSTCRSSSCSVSGSELLVMITVLGGFAMGCMAVTIVLANLYVRFTRYMDLYTNNSAYHRYEDYCHLVLPVFEEDATLSFVLLLVAVTVRSTRSAKSDIRYGMPDWLTASVMGSIQSSSSSS